MNSITEFLLIASLITYLGRQFGEILFFVVKIVEAMRKPKEHPWQKSIDFGRKGPILFMKDPADFN